ncbi:Cilia- and flagella-associated protein [Actinidia chinensis var. chinensis]|uniref:Cilia-and flagella-associated protein n=1 Tax=Actinidia chinensis var. chinensis TaxID=1590841 RepID=A0A2R6PIA5_ACTCC|nr:Cilia- and flagella-associated protein [Actinidia chinensis var. chinensis]
MGDEGFEEWDADFLDQLIQVEELALSSTNPTVNPPPPPRQPASHFLPPPRTAVPYDEISYSPPRELSQRVRDGTTKDFDRSLGGVVDSAPSRNPKEEEIEQLKRELSRVSKQLTHLEQDCLQLREERDKKEEQLKSVYSQIEAKDAEVQCRKSKNSEYGVHSRDHPVLFLGCQNGNSSNNQVGSRVDLGTSTCKAIGVQTEISGESTHLSSKNDLSTCQRRRSNLLAVWDSSKGKGSPRNLVSKLLVACETDFHVLFGCLSLSFKAGMKSLADERPSDVGLRDHNPPTQSAEAAKVSNLYYMLTKTGTGMVKLEALFGALVDLCSVENDVIVYRSMRVLRMVLNYTFGLEMESHRSILYSGIAS